MITFCRMRPGAGVTPLWASTRRRAGTTVVEISGPSSADIVAATSGGLLPAAIGDGEGVPAAWIVDPDAALRLEGVPGWRITILHEGSRSRVVEALARTGAAHLRVRRSMVAEAAQVVALPGIEAVVSVMVDTVGDAVAAVGAGAGDLVLRDWDTESIGHLRDARAIAVTKQVRAHFCGIR